MVRVLAGVCWLWGLKWTKSWAWGCKYSGLMESFGSIPRGAPLRWTKLGVWVWDLRGMGCGFVLSGFMFDLGWLVFDCSRPESGAM